MSEDGADLKMFPVSPEIVRRLAERDGPDAPIRGVPHTSYERCQHAHSEHSLSERTLTCKDCGKVLDPHEWIDRFAREWDGYVYRWKVARRDIEALEAKVADLQRREKNAKARVRNAEHPAAKEARRALGHAADVLWEFRRHFGELSSDGRRAVEASLRCRAAADALGPQRVAGQAEPSEAQA